VLSLKKILTEKYQIPDKNIITLIDSQGTKKNILNALENLDRTTESGDKIFFYFSGHGTSFHDKDFGGNFPELNNTGALIPYDIGNYLQDQDVTKHLIIGKRDIVPRLKQLEKNNRLILAAFDACYSGVSVRSISHDSGSQLSTRYFPLPVEPASTKGNFLSSLDDIEGDGFTADSPQTKYPYENVFYISAAGEKEMAQDIPFNIMQKCGGTVDNQPHGAMTNSLLAALSSSSTDSNNDNFLSMGELAQSVKTGTQKKSAQCGQEHTPNFLPEQGSLQFTAFFQTPNTTTPPSKIDDNNIQPLSLRVLVNKDLSLVQQALTNHNDITITEKSPQYKVNRFDSQIVLFDSLDRPVIRFNSEDEAANMLPTILTRLRSVWHVIEKQYQNSSFNVALDLKGKKGNKVEMGDFLSFTMQPEKEAYLLLLNISPLGQVNVIYPYDAFETAKVSNAKPILLKKLSQVVGKPGTEIMKLFAFQEKPLGYDQLLRQGNIEPGHPSWKLLTELLGISGPNRLIISRSPDIAENTIVITSHRKNEILAPDERR
jgi:hypothetical protein